ncbi:hypothetical protein IWW34DRAFT_635721 [Fusarium oxysporum f. sp. albedinis]|nr:hypothetical protein IWW34DRAFT_635721 [Fusarium oxysporum f. sp. albedinis]
MSCSQMRSNLIGYGGEPTNLAHEKAVCREKNVGVNCTAWFRLQVRSRHSNRYSDLVLDSKI